jgi:hypothetical protein
VESLDALRSRLDSAIDDVTRYVHHEEVKKEGNATPATVPA